MNRKNVSMEVVNEECSIKYYKDSAQIVVSGKMRRFGIENYEAFEAVFEKAVREKPPKLVLDITELSFLNSSGINLFLKFLIALRKEGTTKLTVNGTTRYFWQKKTLQNFQTTLPGTAVNI